MLKNFIKRIAAFAIVALVVSVVAIPAFAEARVTWRNGIVYYDYWFYGGTTQYNEVKQGYINNYGQMTPGSAAYIGYSGTKKGTVEGWAKFQTYTEIPSSISLPSSKITLSFKLMKQNGLVWNAIPYDNGTTSKTITSTYTISRSLGSTQYSTPVYTTLNNISSGNYQFDLTSTYVAPIFTDYILLYFEADVCQAAS